MTQGKNSSYCFLTCFSIEISGRVQVFAPLSRGERGGQSVKGGGAGAQA